jgi:type VI secretion system secreted protein VgrG
MALIESAHEAKFLFKVKKTSLETLVVDFMAIERLSFPFELNVSLACEDEIAFDDVVGKEALLTLLGNDGDRHCHGIINTFKQTGSKGHFHLYRARVVPSLWLLSLEHDCRIFQNLSVQDIVKQILQDGKITADRFDFRLQNQYPPRDYCVQYRETDLNFISRLLEEEGIFYFFEHSEDKHVLVFADSTVAYKPIPGNADLPFNPSSDMVPEEEYVHEFAFSQRILSGKMTRRDFNFEKPSLDLTANEEAKSFQKLEVYDYPGKYGDQNQGKKLAKIRLQESVAFKEKAEGRSICPRFAPGFTFKLTDHERQGFNQEYLLVEAVHAGSQPQVLEEQSGSGEGSSYSNDFLGIPSGVTFRPERKTPKSIVEGPQTALVVGPKGEEIYTDKYGRVKVQFHWDREGKQDDKSSCWIRVGSLFAGGNYGVLFTPRIGQEVIIDFLEGDPDQPLITGRVYNADNMPPCTLPEEKTKSTIKSNTSVGGKGFNEIRFEDEKGKEQIFIHAEMDEDIRVKSDCREWIGNDRHLVVKRDQVEKIERDSHVKIERDEIREITRDHHVTINGKEAVVIVGSRSQTVSGDMIEVFKANHKEETAQTYSLKGMNARIEAMGTLELTCGGNSLVLCPGGIFITGTMVYINSGSGPPVAPPGGQAVSAVSPLVAVVAADAVPGKDAAYQAPSHKEPTDEDEKKKKSWIEIELVDEDNNPIPGERYKVTLPDGKTLAEGTLDPNGFARVNGIDPGSCKITFPNLDKDAWEKA